MKKTILLVGSLFVAILLSGCIEQGEETITLHPIKGNCGVLDSHTDIDYTKLTEKCDLKLIEEKDDEFISLNSWYENGTNLETALFVFEVPQGLENVTIKSSKIYLKNVWCSSKNYIWYSSNQGYNGLDVYSNKDSGGFACEKNNIAGFGRIGFDLIELNADIIEGESKVLLQPAHDRDIPFEVDEIYMELVYEP